MTVGVHIFSKTREENLPFLRKYSKNLPENDSADVGKVIIEKTYCEIDDKEMKEIAEYEQSRAYYYGK